MHGELTNAHDIFQHPVALVNDLICRVSLEGAIVLVEGWCVMLSLF
jgi:hypothetical protein